MAVMLERSSALPTASSTDIKRDGWRALVRMVQAGHRMVAVTANKHREVVVMETEMYDRLVAELTALRQAANPSMAELEASFAERIARMREPAVDAHLRDLFGNPVDLQGAVRVGRGT